MTEDVSPLPRGEGRSHRGEAHPAPTDAAAAPLAVPVRVGDAPPPNPQAEGGKRYRLTALIVASAMFMEGVDGTVLSTAIPAMSRDLGADPVQMNIALTAYLLSLAVFIPASGKIADRFGSRTVFRLAIVLFTLGSVLCGRADGLPFLVAARILQGIGGAMMVPVGRLVLLRSVPKADLISAMAWLLVPATLGPLVGPPLGGFLVTYLSWRWIFDINVPIGIMGIVLATIYIEEVKEKVRSPLDGLGMVLSGVSLACLTFALEFAGRGAGSLWLAALLLAVGIVCGTAYFVHAQRHRSPVLDFRLMRVRTFGVSVLSGCLFRISFGATPFLLPLMLQLGFGMSAAASGSVTFASSLGSLAMRMAAKPVLRRFGFRGAIVGNGVISGVLLAACALFRPDWPIAAIYAVLLLGGFSSSLQFTAYNTIAYADVPGQRMSAATSFYSTFQQIALSMGITVSAGVLAATTALGGRAGPGLADFSIAFVVMGAVGTLSAFPGLRLRRDAGAALLAASPKPSGHPRP